jgi:predicted Zn-dependent protease
VDRFFYNLGRKVGPGVRKAKWLWHSITGDEADVIKFEYEVGQDLACEVRSQVGSDRLPQNVKMLNEIGRQLALRVANKSRTFSFEPITGAEPNAFALPGGFIFVASSLVELCERNRDEVAFILGHEMAHVIRRHAMDRIIRNSAITAASRAVPIRNMLAGWLRNVGVQFLESAYSRKLESEADKLAVYLVNAAGFDAHAGAQLLGRLEKLSSEVGKFEPGNYFSSHPPFKDRIENINRLLRRLEI